MNSDKDLGSFERRHHRPSSRGAWACDELLMPMAFHVAADDGAIENVVGRSREDRAARFNSGTKTGRIWCGE
jgi:hypothetical protein